jgi:hypothetical protein
MTTQSDDPIVEYQARAILELEARVRVLDEHRRALETTIVELTTLIGVYQRSRAVRLANTLQGTPRNLRQWARSRAHKAG